MYVCVCVWLKATKTRFTEAPKVTSSSTVLLTDAQTTATPRQRVQLNQPINHNGFTSLRASQAYQMGLAASDPTLLS